MTTKQAMGGHASGVGRTSQHLWCLMLLFLTLCAARGQTNTLILPKEARTVYGERFANLTPNEGGPIQQIYAASEFSEIESTSIWITGIALRFDEPKASVDTKLTYLLMEMGVFEGTMDRVSFDREVNLQNSQVVFDQINFPFVAAQSSGPSDFTVKLPFKAPFLYERSRGQLVLQLQGGRVTSGGEQSYDAHEVSFNRGQVYF